MDNPGLISDLVQSLFDKTEFHTNADRPVSKERFLIPGTRLLEQMDRFRQVILEFTSPRPMNRPGGSIQCPAGLS